MKYIKLFDNKELEDSSIMSIKHGDSAYIFDTINDSIKENLVFYDQRHPDANCPEVYKSYPVNMEPVKLDESSSKQKPDVADILYATANNKLTLDEKTNDISNTAIAICVIPEVLENFKKGDQSDGSIKTARFVSLNYMSCITPYTGTIEPERMYFGNYKTTVGNLKGEPLKDSYIGGKWNTDKCLHMCIKEQKKLSHGVTNNYRAGYCAPVCCCVVYSTPGTNKGDWYLPSVGELYQIAANEKIINQKRTLLLNSGYIYNWHYSSREKSNEFEYIVALKNGTIGDYSKKYNYFTLSFLAVKI